jgi:hypothetical protein
LPTSSPNGPPPPEGSSTFLRGTVVASLPLTAQSIRYAGVEGSLHGHVDNFTVRAGTVGDPDPEAVAAPETPVVS